jgi:imidazolonepropionase-like amidohydrolase
MNPFRSHVLLPFLLALPWIGLPVPGVTATQPSDPSAGVTAFTGVGVIPMKGDKVRHRDWTVLVEGRRIAMMGPTAEIPIPEGATVINGAGQWLLPGFAEMHAHIPGTPGLAEGELEHLLFLFLSQGVTTIRSMLGAPGHPELRDAIDSGEVLGPNLIAASPSLSGQSTPDPETARTQVRSAMAEGFDLLKLHPGLSRESYDAMVETAREEGISWAGHLSTDVPLEHALETGMSTIDHLDGFLEAVTSPELRDRIARGEAVPLLEVVEGATPERIREVARRAAGSGVRIVPTLHLWETFFGEADVVRLSERPEMRYVAEPLRNHWAFLHQGRQFVSLLESWRTGGQLTAADVPPKAGRALIQLRREIIAALDDAGVPLLMGTDSPQLFMVPGFSTHREIEVLREVGISPLRILESATGEVGRYAAAVLGQSEPFGTLAPGSRADLVLVDGDPLEDLTFLRDPAGVMVRGIWLDRERIQVELEVIAARARLARGSP